MPDTFHLPAGFRPPCRLLVLDIDGTFLNPRKEVSPAVFEAVAHIAGRGLRTVFATGRMWEAIRHWVARLELRTPQITNNGADVIDPGSGERLLNCCLAHEAVVFLLEAGRALNLRTVLFSQARVLGSSRDEADVLIERNNEFVEDVPQRILLSPETRVEKILFLTTTRGRELRTIRDELTERARTIPGIELGAQITEEGILNFCHAQATKLHALRFLCERLGCETNSTVAIGDGDNDAEILAGAGIGLAMGNASPRAREAAHAEIPANDQDGLAWAIRKIVEPLAFPEGDRNISRQREIESAGPIHSQSS